MRLTKRRQKILKTLVTRTLRERITGNMCPQTREEERKENEFLRSLPRKELDLATFIFGEAHLLAFQPEYQTWRKP